MVDGIAGALIGMGIPEYEANRYEGRIKEGGILLSVHADDRDWQNKGKEILERTGAKIQVIKENPTQTVMKPTGHTLKKPALLACGRVMAALIIKEQVTLSSPRPSILLLKNQGSQMSQVINQLLR